MPIDHAKILYNKCHKPYEGWWAKKAGHNNIDIVQRKEYFKKCFYFIESIKEDQRDKSEQDMLKANKASDWDVNYKHFYKKFLDKSQEIIKGSISVSSNSIESKSVKSNEKFMRGFFFLRKMKFELN